MSYERIWSTLMPHWNNYVHSRRQHGHDLADLPHAIFASGSHVKAVVHLRSMPTATSIGADYNNRRAESWFAEKKKKYQTTINSFLLNRFSNSSLLFRATFDDIDSRLRSSVQ